MMIDEYTLVTHDIGIVSDERDTAHATQESVAASVLIAAPNRSPFLHSDFITSDPIIFRDELTRAQSVAAGAAVLASEHTAGLLYSSDVDAHQAPYGAVPVLNSLDAHNWIRGNIWRDHTHR